MNLAHQETVCLNANTAAGECLPLPHQTRHRNHHGWLPDSSQICDWSCSCLRCSALGFESAVSSLDMSQYMPRYIESISRVEANFTKCLKASSDPHSSAHTPSQVVLVMQHSLIKFQHSFVSHTEHSRGDPPYPSLPV